MQRKESGKGRGRCESGRLWLNTTKSIDQVWSEVGCVGDMHKEKRLAIGEYWLENAAI